MPENKTRYVGIDINVKHNLFALSDGSTYDFDRKLVSDYIKCLKQIDTQEVIGKRKQIKLRTFQRKIKQSNQELIAGVCKDLKAKGFDHVILEDLDNSFGRSFIRNLETGEKYTRLTRILNIGSLKDEFKHIAANYDIAASFVQAEYTSQLCECCGTVDSENRPNQETFECIHCGCKMNADIHAAINIRNRVQETVFQKALLKSCPDGTFIPKKISHA